MAFVIYSDEQTKFGYLPQPTWGTGIAADQAFRELKFPKGVFVNPNIHQDDLDLNRSSRIQDLSDIYIDAVHGPVLITAPEMLVTRARAADFLYAAMQNRVSQGAVGTGYSKVYRMNASGPDFTANAGYFFTLAQKGPITAKHLLVQDCIVKSLTLDLDRSGVGAAELVRFRDVNIIARSYLTGQTLSGTWVDTDAVYYNAKDFTLKYNDATAMSWLKFALKIDNGAEILDKVAAGTARTFFLNPAKETAVQVDITTWFNNETSSSPVDLMADYVAGTKRLYTLNSGTVDTADYWKVQFRGILRENPQGAESRQIMAPLML